LAEVARRTTAAEMNDYRLVKYSKKPFKPLYPQHTFQKHAASRRFLEERRSGLRDRKLVFLTHHAPSLRSVQQPRQAEVLTAAYASDLEYLMEDGRGPNLWVHGHLHNKSDYMIGSTRVVSNPRGYPGEPSYQAFDAGFVVVV
jgi:Icc-related predicted phosphoesterase